MMLLTRRGMLRTAAALTGGALAARFYPAGQVRAAGPGGPQQPSGDDPVAASRARFATIPIQTQKLSDNITMLSGPGGNVVVLDGADGKLVGDTFVMPAWPHFKDALDAIGKAPVKIAIDTHWHFDHSDNNAALHAAGAIVLAHANTKKRMSETHVMPVINMTIPPSPPAALPQQTFQQSHKMTMNGESVSLVYIPPAHTDSDIYLHFEKANILQAGDVYFNGTYPYIDSGTGGSVSGTIAGLTKLLAVADNNTKIVPGHGPLGNKADVMKFREMLSTARARLQKLKSSGKSVEEAVAAKPLEDLDAAWGQGLNDSDTFVKIAYPAL
jgi:glyoxylase-like metal-dependent hydrolase (beta-lactamase superfamily II)